MLTARTRHSHTSSSGDGEMAASSTMRRLTRVPGLLVAFLLSGASGLVYEVVWARQLAVMIGGTAAASQAVLGTFFVGLMLGAFLIGPAAAQARDGGRCYGRLELGIAGAGLWSWAALAAARGPVAALTEGGDGPTTAALALATTLVACLPATILMGATFAAVARAVEQRDPGRHAEGLLGRAYAANTAGAVLGSVAGAFVALPLLGVRGTLAAAVAGNLAAAGLAFRAGLPAPAAASRAAVAEGAAAAPARKIMPASLALALALSGFAAITLEILALRILAVTLKDTVYTFASGIAAFIGGAAAAAHALGRRARATTLAPGLALAVAAAASALWLPTLRWAAPLYELLAGGETEWAAVVSAEATVALFVAAPAALPTTWVFLALAARPEAGSAAAGAGRATAWNGIGCAAAPIASALIVLPRWGTVGLATAAVAALGTASVVLLQPRTRAAALRVGPWLLVAAVVVALVRGGLFEWRATPGWRLVWKKEGAQTAVSIEESPAGQRRLRTNNNFTEGGDAALVSQVRAGLLPTLFVPDARRVLVLGVGSGITLGGAVAALPDARFDAVELVPEIRDAVRMFGLSNGGVADRPNVRLHVADARTFAAHAAHRGDSYDLVLGEVFHAGQAGTGALHAREHFENVRRLLPGDRGIYCQWIALHEAPPDDVRTVVRTFFRVFPHGGALLGAWTMRTPLLGLVGTKTPLRLDWELTSARLGAPAERAARAAASEVDRMGETVASFLAGAEALRQWAGQGPENTDDRPEWELGVPRRAGPHLGPENIMRLLPVWRVPDGVVAWGDPGRRAEVAALQAAIASFFRGSFAWLHEDLATAEVELRRAHATSRAFRHSFFALRDLATTWRQAGHPERARALEEWLAPAVSTP